MIIWEDHIKEVKKYLERAFPNATPQEREAMLKTFLDSELNDKYTSISKDTELTLVPEQENNDIDPINLVVAHGLNLMKDMPSEEMERFENFLRELDPEAYKLYKKIMKKI